MDALITAFAILALSHNNPYEITVFTKAPTALLSSCEGWKMKVIDGKYVVEMCEGGEALMDGKLWKALIYCKGGRCSALALALRRGALEVDGWGSAWASLSVKGAVLLKGKVLEKCKGLRHEKFEVKYCEDVRCAKEFPAGELRCAERRPVWTWEVKCDKECVVRKKLEVKCVRWRAEKVCLWWECAKWASKTVNATYCSEAEGALRWSGASVSSNMAAFKLGKPLRLVLPIKIIRRPLIVTVTLGERACAAFVWR